MCFWVVLRTVETVENPYAISETLAGGFEPPTFGLGNRCSIRLSYANRRVAVYRVRPGAPTTGSHDRARTQLIGRTIIEALPLGQFGDVTVT